MLLYGKPGTIPSCMCGFQLVYPTGYISHKRSGRHFYITTYKKSPWVSVFSVTTHSLAVTQPINPWFAFSSLPKTSCMLTRNPFGSNFFHPRFGTRSFEAYFDGFLVCHIPKSLLLHCGPSSGGLGNFISCSLLSLEFQKKSSNVPFFLCCPVIQILPCLK